MPRRSQQYDDGFRDGYKKGIADERRIHEGNNSDLGAFSLDETDLLLSHKQGYVRIGVGSDTFVWARYKWTCGPLEGFYTFGSGPSLSDALADLCGRVQKVEAGKAKPTRDTPMRKYPPKG